MGGYIIPKPKNKGNIIQLMGKETKEQSKKVHLAIQRAFRNNSPSSKEPSH